MRVVADCKSMGDTIIIKCPSRVRLDDGKYEVIIKDFSGMKRSERQNAMLWSIVNKICKKIDGNTEGNYDLYCQILEMSGAEYDDVKIKDVALERFKQLAKHVKVVSQEQDGYELYDYCWVFKGISEMTSKEAGELIDTAMRYASEVGVDVDDEYWRELKNG